MIKMWIAPDREISDLHKPVAVRAMALHQAHAQGARFLALPIKDTFDAACWILACFHSPISVVPFPNNLPEVALSSRLAQLPSNSVIFPEQLSLSTNEAAVPAQRDLGDIWAVIFTSGTTGEPKGVALTGSALYSSALAHSKHSAHGQGCWLLDLPMFHVGGLSILTRALFLKAAVALSLPRFDSELTMRWIRSGKIDGISLVPTTLHRLIHIPEADFSSLKLVLLGGAPSSHGLTTAAIARGVPLRLTYGMTEHASQIATEKAVGAGLEPLPEVEIRIGEDGEITVRSPMLAAGFFQRGQLFPLPLKSGFFPTGDLGSFENNQLSILGRKSDLIVSGGKKVFPREIENALANIPGLRDFAVLGIPDEEWGELICAAIVEVSPGSFDLSKAKQVMRQIIESHKIPKKWVTLLEIPRTASGKVQKNDLKNEVLLALTPNHN